MGRNFRHSRAYWLLLALWGMVLLAAWTVNRLTGWEMPFFRPHAFEGSWMAVFGVLVAVAGLYRFLKRD
jgi:hypothetical protein